MCLVRIIMVSCLVFALCGCSSFWERRSVERERALEIDRVLELHRALMGEVENQHETGK